MVSVASLLNPLPPSLTSEPSSVNLQSPIPFCSPSPPGPPSTIDLEMSKSASLSVKNKANDQVHYKPCEFQDEKIAAEHLKFSIGPLGHIRENPRHIPYSSDKKSFQQRTGRDAIEAYHYTFRVPEDVQKDEHTIMWDYNIGLVRITALFKSLKHTKTMPAKVMNANKGLKEISHSITGGSITAQGYWMPFDAAKAVAATFCWKIRYALTPVFGADFPQLCIEPGNPEFMRLAIDPAIVKRCEDAARTYRAESRDGSFPKSPQSSRGSKFGSCRTPKSLRPKMADIESGYGTDSDRSPLGSPVSTGSDLWVPVNTPRSMNWSQYQLPSPEKSPSTVVLPEPKLVSAAAKEKRLLKKREALSADYRSEVSSDGNQSTTKRRKMSINGDAKKLTQEALAAQTLMELHRADRALVERVQAMSRRVSV